MTSNRNREPQWCWHIEGFDSTAKIFEQSFPVGQMTENRMKELLRALVARHLSPREMVGAYAKRGTRIANGFLDIHKEVQQEKKRTLYTCGHNPHYIATTRYV